MHSIKSVYTVMKVFRRDPTREIIRGGYARVLDDVPLLVYFCSPARRGGSRSVSIFRDRSRVRDRWWFLTCITVLSSSMRIKWDRLWNESSGWDERWLNQNLPIWWFFVISLGFSVTTRAVNFCDKSNYLIVNSRYLFLLQTHWSFV